MIVVVPFGKTLPAGTPLRVTVALPQLSLAVAVPSVASLTTVSQEVAPAPVLTVTSAGAVTVGGVVSTTGTVCVAVAVLPAASVAVHVTVVSPTANVLPDGLRVTVTPGQLSVAVAMPS